MLGFQKLEKYYPWSRIQKRAVDELKNRIATLKLRIKD